MQFPVWDLSSLGGGFWIALVAVVHVYIAHLAVGGGLFLVLTEMWAYKKENNHILSFVRKHTQFFLLLTLVAGGLTGVGIWFTISLLSPEATSLLIRNFVFGWATEWVFFIGEILALLIYYYTFGRMDRKNHVIIGWLYFIFAWLSLVVINGIIGFMLTPGNWLETQNFWDGFFNPSYWPSLVFRTFAAFMIAGLFGFLTAIRMKDKQTRESLIRYCAVWAIVPLALMLLSAPWYLGALPESATALFEGGSNAIAGYRELFIMLAPFIVIFGVITVIKLPESLRFTVASLVVITGFAFFGSFEFMREAARKPYIVHNHMYSNAIPVAAVDEMNEKGYLQTARWALNREISEENFLAAGRELFQFQCLSCHSVGGVIRDIKPRTAKFSLLGMESMLKGLGKINTYMPPFVGTDAERKALAAYIVKELHQKEEFDVQAVIEELPVEVLPFDTARDDYVLVAWNDLGMHCITNTGKLWLLLPPANTISAQLIRRGEIPELVTEGVELRYEAEEGFLNPADHVQFWEYSEALFGVKLEENIGLAGFGMTGVMEFNVETGYYEAHKIPILPYNDDGTFNPYPMIRITAVDQESGEVLMATNVVAPTSTETGCANCHGGNTYEEKIGIAYETAEDVLKVHDRMNGTNLLAQAEAGKPILCQSCHADPALGMEGRPEILNLSASIHGLHANYLTDMGVDACNSCHPSDPDGYTSCMRGVHNDIGLTCVECHGHLEDHALSLLKGELEAGKERAGVLMEHIVPVTVGSVEDVVARRPWMDEPDCLKCHEDYDTPMAFESFNMWSTGFENLYRNRKDDMDALACSACHGAPHSLYPAVNPYGENRDVTQPLQYQENPRPLGAAGNCTACHVTDQDFEAHHPNMIQ